MITYCEKKVQFSLDSYPTAAYIAWLEKEGYSIAGDPRAVYIDGIWNQEDSDKWLTIIQVPVEIN